MSGSQISLSGGGNDRLLLRPAGRRQPVDTGPGAVRLAEGLRGLVVGMIDQIICGDCMEQIEKLPSESVDCCVTSPPYYGLRDYGVDGQIGLEASPNEYVCKLVKVFREVRRVLKSEGVLWLNLGDSYAGSWGNYHPNSPPGKHGQRVKETARWNRPAYEDQAFRPPTSNKLDGLKPKDLIGIPWMVAFALRADGWYLRSDIIWCLSGGAIVYARTQKGDMPQMVKDLVRLDPKTVKLWNGEKWTQAISWKENPRPDNPIELTLRSGERIGCTPNHVWPTQRGNVKASDMLIGDVIKTASIPESESPESPAMLPDSIGWFIGMYLAEGSRSDGTIQISSHTKETVRYDRLCEIAKCYGGSCFRWTKSQNAMTINLNSKILNAIIDTYIGGKVAKDKHLSMACWRRSNEFLKNLLQGYLDGDGHFDEDNNRWRLGFTRNYYLESDLRTICARLHYYLSLRPSISKMGGKEYPSFKGEIRFNKSTHFNNKDMGEVVAIGNSKARKFWDIEVEDEPHLFALASGVLTHNSKPNCMPESVTDRPTKSHEYVFLLSKSRRYYYDNIAIQEKAHNDFGQTWGKRKSAGHPLRYGHDAESQSKIPLGTTTGGMKNKRTVWTIPTKPFSGAHFAVMPEALVEPCILAGTSEKGYCPKCGKPWIRQAEKRRATYHKTEDPTINTGRKGMNRLREGESDKYVMAVSQPELSKMLKAAAEGKESEMEARFGSKWAHWIRTDSSGARIPTFADAKEIYDILGLEIPFDGIPGGWLPSCSCSIDETVPGIVLDPFFGAGTVGLVAAKLGRRWVGIELNPDYCAIARKRIAAIPAKLDRWAEAGP